MSTETWILVTVAIGIACKMSSTIQYYVKFILFMIFTMVNSTIFVPFMLHRPRDSKNGLLPSWACRVTSRLLGVSHVIRGEENIIPEGEGCVVLINHQSSLDLTVMASIWPYTPNGCQVTKKEVFWLFPFGPASWLWGTVFIDKSNPVNAKKAVNETGAYINSKHARVCMFPEGTRHGGDTLLPFKKGAFHIALAAQCKIQPVVVSKYHFVDHTNHRFDSGKNIIEFLPAISTKGLTKDDLPELIEKTQDLMQKHYTRISQESLRMQS